MTSSSYERDPMCKASCTHHGATPSTISVYEWRTYMQLVYRTCFGQTCRRLSEIEGHLKGAQVRECVFIERQTQRGLPKRGEHKEGW